jgi:hypothetical protein
MGAGAARQHCIYDVLALTQLQQHFSSEGDRPQLQG